MAFTSPPVVQDNFLVEDDYPKALGYGSFVVGNDDAHLWIHEAGHVQGLEHCHGIRKTFNAAGLRADSGAVSGFHTIMQYAYVSDDPNAEWCWDGGDLAFTTTPVPVFSNPDSSYSHYHPVLGRDSIYALGTGPAGNPERNAAFFHDTVRFRVSGLRPVPANLVISEDMALKSYDYADFLASGSVVIEPGFRVEPGAKMRLTIGTQALLKYGVDARRMKDVDSPAASQEAGKTDKLQVRYHAPMNALQLAYEASAPGTVSLSLFDAKGGKTFLSRSFEASRGTNHWWIPFRDAPGGVYFVRVRVGSDVYRKRVFIW